MPVYNADQFLPEAIESVLDQTFHNFEFIIISDDISEKTQKILEYYRNKDNRIKIVYHDSRKGLVYSLNEGCFLSQGKYIARMDADDISYPERFEKQFEFLERHPDIGVCGTWMEHIKSEGSLIQKPKTPISHNLIEWNLFFGNPMDHPTIMMRKNAIENYGYYNIEGEFAEDYDLWARLIFHTKFANLPQYLFKYRFHDNNVSKINSNQQSQMNNKIQFSLLKQFFLNIAYKPDITFIESDLWGTSITNYSQVEKQFLILKTLYNSYLNNRTLSKSEKNQISQDFAKKILHFCIQSLKFNNTSCVKFGIYAIYLSPPIIIKEIVVISINFLVKVLRKIY